MRHARPDHLQPPHDAPLLRDECGAATMHWISVGVLLLFAALLAYPDLSYSIDRTLYGYGIDLHIPWIWN